MERMIRPPMPATQRNAPHEAQSKNSEVSSRTPKLHAIALGAACLALTVNVAHATTGVKAWGLNGLGQLGDGTYINRSSPINTHGLPNGVTVTMVAAGAGHSLALLSDGTVRAWGFSYAFLQNYLATNLVSEATNTNAGRASAPLEDSKPGEGTISPAPGFPRAKLV